MESVRATVAVTEVVGLAADLRIYDLRSIGGIRKSEESSRSWGAWTEHLNHLVPQACILSRPLLKPIEGKALAGRRETLFRGDALY